MENCFDAGRVRALAAGRALTKLQLAIDLLASAHQDMVTLRYGVEAIVRLTADAREKVVVAVVLSEQLLERIP